MKHGEAVMMFRGDNHVSLAGGFRSAHPAFGVEVNRIELFGELLILGDRNFRTVHDPFANTGNLFTLPFTCRNSIEAPMDKHAEARVTEPRHPVWIGLGNAQRRNGSKQADDYRKKAMHE